MPRTVHSKGKFNRYLISFMTQDSFCWPLVTTFMATSFVFMNQFYDGWSAMHSTLKTIFGFVWYGINMKPFVTQNFYVLDRGPSEECRIDKQRQIKQNCFKVVITSYKQNDFSLKPLENFIP